MQKSNADKKTPPLETEIARLRCIFEKCDEGKLELLEGQIIENARMRCQIDDLNKIIAVSGLIRVHPQNPAMQKEVPAAKQLVRLRAGYINSTKLLCKELGAIEDDIDGDLEEFN